MSINNKLIPVPFAVNAGDTYKYSIPQTNTTTYPNKATYETGFPAVTMADIAAGGVPPFGQDFNGVLNDITTAIRYIQSGNYQTYDSAFATSIGGYDKGSVILGSDGKLYQSTVDANKTNPVGGSGWAGFIDGKYLPLTGGTLTGTLTGTDITAKTSLTVGSAKATYSAAGLNFDKQMTINSTPVLKRGDYGVGGKAVHLTNSSTNINDVTETQFSWYNSSTAGEKPASAGWVISSNILDSQAMQISVGWGGAGLFFRDSTGGVFNAWKTVITTENIGSYQSGLGVNQTWQDVKSSRSAGAIYTNTTGRPITVNITTGQDGGGWAYLYVDDVIVAGYFYTDRYGNGSVLSAVVPNNSTYKLSAGAVSFWAELR
ncbi:hypothetical protein DES39_0568 [Orbus hercynius]|uniref:Tail fiber protein n=1 Tax=Orbus hercynius TaxID=593135 RepID=A0A495RIK8_9GAMM|nr:hypothetical protein [Orbus hercynius]RKS87347.1 hypothetical protein DES39_0568 [Orbus hercynius]